MLISIRIINVAFEFVICLIVKSFSPSHITARYVSLVSFGTLQIVLCSY